MRKIIALSTCLAVLGAPMALADGPKKPQPNPAYGHKAHCPPGLAKKDPACIPPGQAKKQPPYRVGERIGDGFIILRDPERYRLDRNHSYYEVDGYVFRVNRETREVLEVIGAISALLD